MAMTNNSSFETPVTAPPVAPPDPNKRVMYSQGMVLGVDDFDQEFAYLSGRDQWLARDLIGYGTVCGLHVSPERTGRPRILVSEGTAVSPHGQKITVPDDQCAYLEDWLGTRTVQDGLTARLGNSPLSPFDLPVYVVLCYRECPTERLPIPGEPCRTNEQAVVATRIQDHFRLELRFDPPAQTEEDAVRDFVGWLSAIPITDSLPPTPPAEFAQAIRDAVFVGSPLSPFSPVSPLDFMMRSPPVSLVIPIGQACEYLRTALRIWTTELRPRWRGAANGCDQLPDEECVLLAQVTVPVARINGNWRLGNLDNFTVDESQRPFLLHLRLLQEMMICRRMSEGGGSGSPGASVELRVQGSFIQWRRTDDNPTWTDLISLDALRGPQGSDGASAEMRRQDTFIQWRQSDDNPTWTTLFELSELAGTGTPGASVELRVQGNFIQWRRTDDNPTWTDLISLDALRGPQGSDGASAEMRRQDNDIQWRQSDDDPTWTTLFNLSELAGASVEMRVTRTFIQWRRTDDNPTWTTLVRLEDLRGPQGLPGDSFIVAAGRFDIDGNPGPTPPNFRFRNLTATRIDPPGTLYHLVFDGFNPEGVYVVKGTVINSSPNGSFHTFELIEGDEIERIREETGLGVGFFARVAAINNEPTYVGFSVEISQFEPDA
jgi:hypothetical protein